MRWRYLQVLDNDINVSLSTKVKIQIISSSLKSNRLLIIIWFRSPISNFTLIIVWSTLDYLHVKNSWNLFLFLQDLCFLVLWILHNINLANTVSTDCTFKTRRRRELSGWGTSSKKFHPGFSFFIFLHRILRRRWTLQEFHPTYNRIFSITRHNFL